MDSSMPGFPVLHDLPGFAQIHVHWLGDILSNHLILWHPLLLLPSVFPSIRIFSNESALCIRWPKHWSFSFSISPCSEYSGLISFRRDWFDLRETCWLHLEIHFPWNLNPDLPQGHCLMLTAAAAGAWSEGASPSLRPNPIHGPYSETLCALANRVTDTLQGLVFAT